MDYKIEIKNGFRYIAVPELKEKGLNLCITTRDMDIGLKTNGNIEEINKNFDYIYDFMGVKPTERYSGYQIHSDNIGCIRDISEGEDYPTGKVFYDTDGLVTDLDNIAIISRFADCTPVILYDPVKRVQANVHSGWKGTLLKIGGKAVDKMTAEYGCNPQDIIAVLGPTIGKDDFEVDDDVMIKFKETFDFHKEIIRQKNDTKYLIDLHETSFRILIESGIRSENITIIDLSTFSNGNLLHSYRRDKSEFGLMGAISVLI